MSKRKKHNPNKRAQNFFNCVRMWSWESMQEDGVRIAHGEARLGMIWRALSQEQVRGIVARNNNWVIVCRALCHCNGETWVETESRSARNVKVNDFANHYEELRDQVLSCVQSRHVYDLGWVIQSFGKTDRIDSNLEMVYLGEPLESRRMLWLEAHEEKAA